MASITCETIPSLRSQTAGRGSLSALIRATGRGLVDQAAVIDRRVIKPEAAGEVIYPS